MGQLTERLKTTKQALNKALEQRNEYEGRLATIRTDKSMTAIEREREAKVIKSFIEVYEEDAEQARKDLLSAEVELNEWLDKTTTQFNKDELALQKEVAELQKLNDELNKRVNLAAEKIRKMSNVEYTVKQLSVLVSDDSTERWKVAANQMDVVTDKLRNDNAKAAQVYIKTFY